MRKLMLGTAAVALAASLASSPASAQVKLDVSGYTKMYLSWLDQDERPDDVNTTAANSDESLDVRNLELMRDTEIHFSGETTLDNGLTVGFHTEATADAAGGAPAGDSFGLQESYAYFSGAWGRVNLGAEDGATYLLQVAAPSADSNVDGIRQWISPVRGASMALAGDATTSDPGDSVTFRDIFGGGGGLFGAGSAITANEFIFDAGAFGSNAGESGDILAGAGMATAVTAGGLGGSFSTVLDYDHDVSGWENKITYMTPVFNGFQAGISYTPELGHNGVTHNLDDTVDDYGSVWELAARYEGQWDQLGVTIGGGWSHADHEAEVDSTAAGAEVVFYNDLDGDGAYDVGESIATMDDREAWNVGVDFDWMAFGLGGGYMEDDNGVSGDELKTETWFVGLDYTTGPFKLGATYLSQDQDVAAAEIEQDRWTAGVIYTYGPGMTFRGSISFTDFDENLGLRTANTSASDSADATSFLLGTQIDF